VARIAGTPYVVVSGLAVLMVTWIFVMPPAGGLDEFAHIFRAASVAHGQWSPVVGPSGAADGVVVPADVAAAARPQCHLLNYTTDADCVGTARDGSVVLSDSAARYHPAFYAVVGVAARPFHGTAALYVMRLATAALVLLFVALALAALGTWARSRTAYLGPIVAATPMLVYSSSIVAPNGPEMTAALAFWTSTIGLLVADVAHRRRLLVIAAVSGVALATFRSLGPVWCLCIAAAVVIAVRARPGRTRELLRHPGALVAAAVVALSAIQNAAWVVHMGTLPIADAVSSGGGSTATSLGHRMTEALLAVPVWLLQTIGAFPVRNPAHPAVYVCYLVLFVVLMTAALRSGDRRLRWGIGAVVVVALLIPVVVTVRTYDALSGIDWQGRYELPLLIGLVVLAAYALDRDGRTLPTPPGAAAALFVVAQAVAPVYVLHLELGTSPLVHSAQWVRPPWWLVVVGAAAGAALAWSGSVRRDHEETPSSGREQDSATHSAATS
jgi:hypothetical protein